MRNLMIAACAVAVLAVSPLAALAAEASGAIGSVDATAGTVTLADGTTYILPRGFDAASLQAGSKVKIIFEKGGDGTMTATAVQPAG